jgi:hypothetical protein
MLVFDGPTVDCEMQLSGYDASLLIVGGDPTRDIAGAERVSTVVFKAGRIRRVELFDTAKHPLE